ncbi:ATP-binding cassette domain-containing protein [Acuticoccus kandeliae]|uniref:ATP-binding cassette domain-containing protein n=1 Tax=Acuticoccus kandeliae TaxID=2073160 RepID=UPI000D3E304C|nr:ATP-binding cassette domain-containing protein [Acuticoccus kandeliae]
MSGAQIVSFEDVMRARAADSSHVIDEAELRARQKTIPLKDCHAAFENLTFEIRTKKRRIPIFHDLSATFPKGRKIVVLGHKGSGKSTLFTLLLQQAPPTRGEVHVNSRLSWPIHLMTFMEPRLSVRQNAIFFARILGVDPAGLIHSIQSFCGLSHRAMEDSVKSLPTIMRRRMGIIVALAANFDCLLIDSPFRASGFGLKGDQGAKFEELILSYDYIISVSSAKQIPPNADLAYLLYNGHLYHFDDVALAASVFGSLPVPVGADAGRQQQADDDAEDDEVREEVY